MKRIGLVVVLLAMVSISLAQLCNAQIREYGPVLMHKFSVPKDYPTIQRAIDAIADMPDTHFRIDVAPGTHEGFSMKGWGLFQKKMIAVVCSDLGRTPAIIYSNQPSTIWLEAGTLIMKNCQIENSFFYSPDTPPEQRWQNAAIVAAFGVSLELRNNSITSRNYGVSMSYVEKEIIVENTIKADRLAVAHFNNNRGKREDIGNTIVNSRIGHFYSIPIQTPDMDTFANVGAMRVFRKTFETDIADSAIRDEFRQELLQR